MENIGITIWTVTWFFGSTLQDIGFEKKQWLCSLSANFQLETEGVYIHTEWMCDWLTTAATTSAVYLMEFQMLESMWRLIKINAVAVAFYAIECFHSHEGYWIKYSTGIGIVIF